MRGKLVNGNGCFIHAEHVLPEPSQAGCWVAGAEELWKQLAVSDKCEQISSLRKHLKISFTLKSHHFGDGWDKKRTKNLSGASDNSFFRQCFLRHGREWDAVCGSFWLIHAEPQHLGGRIWTTSEPSTYTLDLQSHTLPVFLTICNNISS